ncbi:hypothetical protein S7335_5309 [Synechococcus sp. PCC 7335]|uniref:hypothetical protein n=1 Tax=Synechococcus sp. (strain ATCC 29403 / PCC 7335) TaxID=91464 RepID=UPI00017EDD4B|nr:hypothetical protein [Synechococcus sp. PCC 7335]EDX87599.1 hypothetical protein S7335_5309 [Synechococcus sp. PCC 7335]
MAKRVVLTDLDEALGEGWLEIPESIPKVKSVLAQLRATGSSVVLFSVGDRLQLELIRRTLEINDPFIVESGSAIFTPVDQNPFEMPLGDRDGAYFVMQLGCPYVQARAGLRVIANMISYPLKGFGDFTIPQLQRLVGLSEEAAHQAKAREFSELFMTPKAIEPTVLKQAAEAVGFNVIWRAAEESRFSELLGAGADLTAAVQALLSAYASSGEPLAVLGLSRRQSTLAGLHAAIETIGNESTFKEHLLASASADSWIEAIEFSGFL